VKTRFLLAFCLAAPAFTLQVILLLIPLPTGAIPFSRRLPPSDTIDVYLFQQLCAGQTFNGLVWHHDTTATFFRPGTNGTDTLQTIEIDVIPPPQVILVGDSLLCKNDSGTLAVLGFFSAYQWSTGTSTPDINFTLPGNYSVTITASNGCTGVNAVDVAVSMPDFKVEFQGPQCAGVEDGFIAVNSFFGGQAPYELSLNGGDFGADSIFQQLAAGDYLLALRDAAGCADTLSLSLTAPLPFMVNIGPDLFLAAGDTLRLSGSATDSVVTWSWQPAKLFDCAKCPMPVILHPTSANITLQVINADGCQASDNLALTYDTEVRLFVPNVFSPNEDGENDLLLIFPGKGNWEITEFLVFDRWGNKVFGSEQAVQFPQTLEWNGRNRAKVLLPGVYSWAARLRFPNGSEELRTGDVTIIR